MERQVVRTVFALTRVALDHLVSALEAGEGHLSDRVLFVRSLLLRDDGSVGGKREVNTGESIDIKRQTLSALRKGSETHGTRLVWNSFKSTLREPSKRREAVTLETT